MTIKQTSRVSIRLSDDARNRLYQLACEQGCSISDIIREAINLYLEEVTYYEYQED